MAWTSTYWDIIGSYFWTPKKLGLHSIPKKYVDRSCDPVPIPRHLLNPTGPLYRRVDRGKDAIATLKQSEEPLNDIFDITFAILADELVREILFERVHLRGHGSIVKLGRDLDAHFKKAMKNVTQPDGFYVTPSSILCVEMKLADDTRLEQIAKYAFLIREEELRTGRRDELGLLFVVPARRKAHFDKQYVQNAQTLAERVVNRAQSLTNKKAVDREIAESPEDFRDILRRVRCGVLSWTELAERLSGVIDRTDRTSPEGQTLVRLLDGFRQQIVGHGGTGSR